MYGQMTAGSWIYIGTQGILQGTYETLAELARRAFRRHLAGRLVVTAGLGGMGGAQPLAVTMNGGVALVVEVDPAAHPAAAGDALRRRARRRRSTTRWRASSDCRARRRRAVDRASKATPPTCCPSSSAAASCRTSSPIRRRRTTRSNGYVPNGLSLAEAAAAAPHRSGRRTSRRAMARDGDARPRDARAAGARRGHVRLRQQHPRAGGEGRRRRRVRHSRLRARVHPAAVLPRQGAVPLGGALGRSGRHRRDRSPGARDVRATTTPLCRWIRLAPRARRVPGTAGADLLARVRRARAIRPGDQRSRPARRASRRRSSSAAITSTPDRSPRRTARPRACATAATRSRTGRC